MRASALCSFAILLLVPLAAEAQQRTFVASIGVDTNPCSRTAPCRTFGAAVAAVMDGGEVIVLDSAGYGPVTIAQSVSLIAPDGVYAGIAASTGAAILVSAPSSTVVIRGLSLNGSGGGYRGIDATAAVLHIENCTLLDFPQFAIGIRGTSAAYVDGTTVVGGGDGIFPGDGSGVVDASVRRCRLEGTGIVFQNVSGSKVTVSETTIANASQLGILANTVGGKMDIKNCVITNSTTAGIQNQGTIVTVADSMVTGSGTYGLVNFDNTGAQTLSFGNNQVTGNGTAPTNGTITPVAQQ